MEKDFDNKKTRENLLAQQNDYLELNGTQSIANVDEVAHGVKDTRGEGETSLKQLTICAVLFICFFSFEPFSDYEYKTDLLYKDNAKIFPFYTRVPIVVLLVFGLMAHTLRYTPVIIFGIIAEIASLLAITQLDTFTEYIFYLCGSYLGIVAQIVFVAYMYHRVPSKKYQFITSWMFFAYLLGSGAGNVLRWQLTPDVYTFPDPTLMLWLTFASRIIALIIFIASFSMTRSSSIDFGFQVKNLKRILKNSRYMVLLASWIVASTVVHITVGAGCFSTGIVGGMVVFIPLLKSLRKRTKAKSLTLMIIVWPFTAAFCYGSTHFDNCSETGRALGFVFLLFWSFFQAIFFTETARVIKGLCMPEEMEEEENENDGSHLPLLQSNSEDEKKHIPPFSTVFCLIYVFAILMGIGITYADYTIEIGNDGYDSFFEEPWISRLNVSFCGGIIVFVWMLFSRIFKVVGKIFCVLVFIVVCFSIILLFLGWSSFSSFVLF